MLRVGLTGSIAVGKSYVALAFAEFGCRVVDADLIAREVVEPGSKGLRSVVQAFGNEVLLPDNSLNRQKLAEIIFSDQEKRLLLNSILHPLIISAQDEAFRQAAQIDAQGVFMVDAALMIESGSFSRFDKIVVVHCRDDLQLNRLMSRDNLTREEALRRIASQMPQEEKKRYADFLIDTSDNFESTRQQTLTVVGKLRELNSKYRSHQDTECM